MNDAAHTLELLRSLYVMASVVEARDPYTGGHLWRVSQFARVLAEEAGLDEGGIARIALGGFLHDLGKIAVPDAVLRKPGKLTDDEYEIIKTHPDVGARLLAGHPLAGLVMEAVYAHHETPDGKGYPRGLKGPEISTDARIVGLVDAFDAMTSSRPYRQGMPRDKALGIIAGAAGTQFDPALAAAFGSLGQRGALDHIIGHSDLGIPLQECPECGPIIVIRRDQKDGDAVYCRNCGYRPRVARQGELFSLAETDDHGTVAELEPEIDMPLVSALVAEALKALRPGRPGSSG